MVTLPKGVVHPDGPVFISYRDSDGKELAESLATYLRAAGVVPWIDTRDLGSGSFENRIEEAFRKGLSGGVLVVTPEIKTSEPIRELELPYLLELVKDPEFCLSIANTITKEGSTSEPDLEAPDKLLFKVPEGLLKSMHQSAVPAEGSEIEVAREQLKHRIDRRFPGGASEERAFTIGIQTRKRGSARDASSRDLEIRIDPPTAGSIPSSQALDLLRRTLPLIADTVYESEVGCVQISGGAHLIVALALGMALPITRRKGTVVEVVQGDEVWSSKAPDGFAPPQEPRIEGVDLPSGPPEGPSQRVAVSVMLSKSPNRASFLKLLEADPNGFAAAATISMPSTNDLDPREASHVSECVADLIRDFARDRNVDEVHLAYQGPFPMAILIGRRLNTLSVVAYEWDSGDPDGSHYTPSLLLQAGRDDSPIKEVLLPCGAASCGGVTGG